MSLRGPASVAAIITAQLASAVLSSVNVSEKYSNTAGGGVQLNPAQQITTRGRTYTNMSMHEILKRV